MKEDNDIESLNLKIEELTELLDELRSEKKRLKVDKVKIEKKLSQYNTKEEEDKLLRIIENKKKDISADPRSLKNLNNTLLQLRKKENSARKLLDEVNNSLLEKENLIKMHNKNIRELKKSIKDKERELKKSVDNKKIYIINTIQILRNDNQLNTILLNYIENILVDNILNSLEIMNILESYFEREYFYNNDEFKLDNRFIKYIDSISMLTDILCDEKVIEEKNPYLVWLILLIVKGKNIVENIDQEYGVYDNIDTLIENIVEDYNSKLIANKSNIIVDISYYYAIKKNLALSANKLKTYYDELLVKFNKYQLIVMKRNKKEQFRNKLFSKLNSKIYTIDDIDLMNGLEFELFLKNLFESKKYKVNITKNTGDQGIDIIIEKTGQRIGIQAKRYSNSVGNSAVQQAIAGKAYYNLDKVIVVTNNYFTKPAIELAEVNDVILWDRNILKEKL